MLQQAAPWRLLLCPVVPEVLEEGKNERDACHGSIGELESGASCCSRVCRKLQKKRRHHNPGC